ncbi:hypothetical protein [Hyalangium rubrum]|uniref:Uncharacterized protein n=1 Tax=Hyalangium rubrum TaxID=3103134 RepID=A0ABU5H2I4_9BACT|nr:hypothetical protein [Hyalangium sp. s54d21]MDY7227672.1 hypothetical protein [Hyalangium sp. s54d21]
MKSRQASGPGKRWEEALLGGVAGLGARVLVLGAARLLGVKSGPVALGGMAGLLGALVGGGIARRHFRQDSPQREETAVPEPMAAAVPAVESEEEPEDERWEPRRGPNGRERLWHLREDVAHMA